MNILGKAFDREQFQESQVLTVFHTATKEFLIGLLESSSWCHNHIFKLGYANQTLPLFTPLSFQIHRAQNLEIMSHKFIHFVLFFVPSLEPH